MQSLYEPLRRAAALHGGAQAVACGDVSLTYRELDDRVRRLAGGLRGLGVQPGDRVATLMANCHRYMEAYFAVPGMGAVLVPLNNRHALPEHRYILSDAGARVVLADEANADVAGQLDADVVSPEDLVGGSAPIEIGAGVHEDDLSSLFYTGGTTGVAKGVMLSHRNHLAQAMKAMIGLGYRPDSVYLHAAPMFHLADGLSTYAVTWLGGRHAFVPAFEPAGVLDAIERRRVTHVTLVPVMINALINHPGVGDADLSSLRQIMHGGAPIQTELLRRAIATLGCSFIQAYGCTETSGLLTLLPNEEALVDDPRLRSAGREIVGVQIRVVREDGSPCEPGEVGEIIARADNVMLGYWNKPEVTAAALRDGWYRTNDLCYRDDDGYLYIVDRSKDMIISGGENVYSTEVEEAVYQHPAVLEAAVIGVPDDHWGERVHAVVVVRDGHTLEADELKTFCKQRIAGYKCPRSVEFIDALPKSGAGKIVKKDLRDRHWAGLERSVH